MVIEQFISDLILHFISDSILQDLGEDFGNDLYVVKSASMTLYGCWKHNDIHGLAVFNNSESTENFIEVLKRVNTQEHDFIFMRVPYDEAVKIALERGPQIVALLLLDDLENPRIRWIR